MITPEEAWEHIGDPVIYRPDHAGGRAERGVIASVNDTYIFVRYDGRWQSQATYPRNLTLAVPNA